MIKIEWDGGYKKVYQFSPNHDSHKVCGQFALIEFDEQYEIWALGIFGEYRNKGYGTQMLTEFLLQFQSNKPLLLYVYKTNEIAIKLYKKVGFAIVGERSPSIYTMQYMNCS
jgi:ribosomal protein S18 acetylase RimI-like enzyme